MRPFIQALLTSQSKNFRHNYRIVAAHLIVVSCETNRKTEVLERDMDNPMAETGWQMMGQTAMESSELMEHLRQEE